MFYDFLFYTVVSFFAIYGFIQVVIYVYDFICDIKSLKDKVIYTVVAVKNDKEKTEEIARSLLVKVLRNDSGIADNRVILIDMGADKETKEILNLVEKERRGITVLEKEEFYKELEKSI